MSITKQHYEIRKCLVTKDETMEMSSYKQHKETGKPSSYNTMRKERCLVTNNTMRQGKGLLTEYETIKMSSYMKKNKRQWQDNDKMTRQGKGRVTEQQNETRKRFSYRGSHSPSQLVKSFLGRTPGLESTYKIHRSNPLTLQLTPCWQQTSEVVSNVSLPR